MNLSNRGGGEGNRVEAGEVRSPVWTEIRGEDFLIIV